LNIYIQTDIEGVAGVTFFENRKDASIENHAHRERMRKLLTNEVNAAVKAAFACGATTVLVNDNHGSGYNIIFEELDPKCEIIHGRNFSGPHWLPELDESFDALLLVGMHAMGGTENSCLPHSRWEVNGGEIYLSEASMAAAIAGDMGIPTVFISGDNKITEEVKSKIPEIETAVVKKALSVYQARSHTPSTACEMIYSGAKHGIGRRKIIKPYIIPGPVKLNLLDSADHSPPLEKMLTEDVTAETINDAFLKFENQMPWTKFPVTLPDGFKYP